MAGGTVAISGKISKGHEAGGARRAVAKGGDWSKTHRHHRRTFRPTCGTSSPSWPDGQNVRVVIPRPRRSRTAWSPRLSKREVRLPPPEEAAALLNFRSPFSLRLLPGLVCFYASIRCTLNSLPAPCELLHVLSSGLGLLFCPCSLDTRSFGPWFCTPLAKCDDFATAGDGPRETILTRWTYWVRKCILCEGVKAPEAGIASAGAPSLGRLLTSFRSAASSRARTGHREEAASGEGASRGCDPTMRLRFRAVPPVGRLLLVCHRDRESSDPASPRRCHGAAAPGMGQIPAPSRQTEAARLAKRRWKALQGSAGSGRLERKNCSGSSKAAVKVRRAPTSPPGSAIQIQRLAGSAATK